MAEVPSSCDKYAEIVALQAQIYVLWEVYGRVSRLRRKCDMILSNLLTVFRNTDIQMS